jgi:hypothetical protein
MNTVKLPGFTAEASLYLNTSAYSRGYSEEFPNMVAIIPAQLDPYCDFWAWKCTRPPRNHDYESPGWYLCMRNVGC